MPLESYSYTEASVLQTVQYPFGSATQRSVAYAAAVTQVVANETILNFAILTGAMTLNLDIESNLPVGTKLHIKVPATATEVLTFGTGFTAPTITGVAGKTKIQSFYYNGTVFIPMGAPLQIN